MQREILFRVWDNTLKRWLPTEDGIWFDIEGEYGGTNKANLSILIKSINAFSVRQFTGLLDKNEKKIFEGDILKCPQIFSPKNYSIGFVVFQNGSFKLAKGEEQDEDLKPFGFWDCYGFNDTPTRSDFWDQAEIIGNIFETPELLQ